MELKLEVLHGQGLTNAEYRFGDFAAELFGVKELNPFVEVKLESQKQQSPPVKAFDGVAIFEWKTLLDLRGEDRKLSFRVYDKKDWQAAFGGDPLIGEAELVLPEIPFEETKVELALANNNTKWDQIDRGQNAAGMLTLQYSLVYTDASLKTNTLEKEQSQVEGSKSVDDAGAEPAKINGSVSAPVEKSGAPDAAKAGYAAADVPKADAVEPPKVVTAETPKEEMKPAEAEEKGEASMFDFDDLDEHEDEKKPDSKPLEVDEAPKEETKPTEAPKEETKINGSVFAPVSDPRWLGKWRLDKESSELYEPVLEDLGVNWALRKVADAATSVLTISVDDKEITIEIEIWVSTWDVIPLDGSWAEKKVPPGSEMQGMCRIRLTKLTRDCFEMLTEFPEPWGELRDTLTVDEDGTSFKRKVVRGSLSVTRVFRRVNEED